MKSARPIARHRSSHCDSVSVNGMCCRSFSTRRADFFDWARILLRLPLAVLANVVAGADGQKPGDAQEGKAYKFSRAATGLDPCRHARPRFSAADHLEALPRRNA